MFIQQMLILVLDYKLLGRTRVAIGTPHFVLKARRHKDHHIVFINICICDDIPLPPAGSPVGLFYFVASKQITPKTFNHDAKSVTCGTFAAVDLFLNPKTVLTDDTDSVRTADTLFYSHTTLNCNIILFLRSMRR